MSKIFCLLLFIFPLCSHAQSHPVKAMNHYGNVVKDEVVYIQTDRPFYEPHEKVFVNLFVVNNQTKTYSTQSSGVTVEVFEPNGNKIHSHSLALDKQNIYFDFNTGELGGFYKIRVKTPYSSFLDSNAYFEKEIQVQDIQYTQVLMNLELDKIAYNRGDALVVNGSVKNRDGLLLRNTGLSVSLWINGLEDEVVQVRTDQEGRFKSQLKIKDTTGIYMVALLAKLDYAGIPISRFKHVPFNSGMLQVNFFPEGGWMLQGVESRVAFQSTDVFGVPTDVKGAIFDSKGSKVAEFMSAYGGMGVVSFKPLPGMIYHARINRNSEDDLRVDLPAVLESGTVIKGVELAKQILMVRLESTAPKPLNVVLRRGDTVVSVSKMESAMSGDVKFKLTSVQMGIHEIAVFDEAWNIKCTRRVFLRPDKKLNIDISFSEKVYQTGKIAAGKVIITDESGKPVQTKFSLSIYNEQLNQYAEDNRENMLSALYLSSELIGKIHQPAYYFKDLDSARLSHLDLLMMTHGWRRIQWEYAMDTKNKKLAKAMAFKSDPRVLSASFYISYSGRRGRDFDYRKAKLICLNNRQVIPLTPEGFVLFGINHSDPLKFKLIYKKRFVYRFTEKSIAVKSLDPYLSIGTKYEENLESPYLDTDHGIGLESSGRSNSNQPKLNVKSNYSDQALDEANLNIETDIEGKKGRKLQGLNEADREIEFDRVRIVEDASESLKMSSSSMSIRSQVRTYDDGYARYDQRYDSYIVHYLNSLVGANLYPNMYYFSSMSSHQGNLVYYHNQIITDATGISNFSFFLPNETMSCFSVVECLTSAGKIGVSEAAFSIVKPITVTFNVPKKLVIGDKVKLPLIIDTKLDVKTNLKVTVAMVTKMEPYKKTLDTGMVLSSDQPVSFWLPLNATCLGSHKVYLDITVNGSLQSNVYEIQIEPKGKPQSFVLSSNQSKYSKSFEITDEILSKELNVNVTLQNSTLDMFRDNAKSIICQPSGCFEQVSSRNYPNIIAYQLIKQLDPQLFLKNQTQMETILRSGYSQLAAYETKQGGFEWYGNTPPHEGLTAYGLLQFHELKQTGLTVDEKLEKRTMKWLMSRFNTDGSINVNAGRYGFSGASVLVTTAYVTYVLSAISDFDLSTQIKYIEGVNSSQNDAYINALLAGIYLNRNHHEKAKLLLENNFNQFINSKFERINASESIVRSGGKDLVLEVLGLTACLAYQANEFRDQRQLAVQKIFECKNKYGFYGNTQSNVWVMKAIAEWYKFDKLKYESGDDNERLSYTLVINGNTHDVTSELDKTNRCALSIPSSELKPGLNQIEVICKGLNDREYSVVIEYETIKLNTDKGPLKLESKCVATEVKVGSILQFNYQLTNTQSKGLPQTVIVIPLSAGMEVAPDQMRALREMNKFDYYEIRNDQLILYYAELGPAEVRNIPITFKITYTGTFTIQQPTAYVYYQAELCAFGTPQTIKVID